MEGHLICYTSLTARVRVRIRIFSSVTPKTLSRLGLLRCMLNTVGKQVA